jgi:ABC-2 type transport system ATP-binding protein
MSSVITVNNLQKTYADGTQAVKGISFAVEQGEFFGFLGPNGAGKSTTIKILITLLDKSGGDVNVLGFDVAQNPTDVRRLIGYAAQDAGIDDDLTGRENLIMQGRLFHLAPDVIKQRVAELLALMDLTDDADRAAGSYSGGMRKRLDLATALIQRPEILFLDEPTTGLDPQTRANLWRYLERVNREEGLTIFLTTHYMEEADRLCHRLAIIDHGEIIGEGSPAELKAELGGDVVTLKFAANGVPAETAPAQAADLLRELSFVREIMPFNEGVNVIVANGGTAVPQIVHALDNAHLDVTQLTLTSPTLDDVFLKYTGSTIRRDEANTNWASNRRGGMFGGRRRPGA